MINRVHCSKFQTEIEVYRRESRKLPIGDPDVDWEETVYLNLILHEVIIAFSIAVHILIFSKLIRLCVCYQFEYTLTCAICTRTSPKDLQVLRRHSQVLYIFIVCTNLTLT